MHYIIHIVWLRLWLGNGQFSPFGFAISFYPYMNFHWIRHTQFMKSGSSNFPGPNIFEKQKLVLFIFHIHTWISWTELSEKKLYCSLPFWFFVIFVFFLLLSWSCFIRNWTLSLSLKIHSNTHLPLWVKRTNTKHNTRDVIIFMVSIMRQTMSFFSVTLPFDGTKLQK